MTNTISTNVSTGVVLTAPAFGNPVTIASGVTVSGNTAVSANSSWTVQNYGTITGTSTSGSGVYLRAGGSVTNEAQGSIGGYNGVLIGGAAGTVENTGTITGTGADGVFLVAGGSVTNAAGGSIGGASIGVFLNAGGSVTNEAHGSIGGGVYGIYANGSSVTVENAGTITGGTDSVDLQATGTNRLIVDPSAVFTGKVVANANAANTLELASGASAGTISGIGVGGSHKYQNFRTVTIDSGANWTVGGTIRGSTDGIDIGAGASLTVAAGSLITGYSLGVSLAAGGSVTNEMGGSISGYFGVRANGTSATVENAGTISGSGANSVYLDATGTNRLIVDPGATFTGAVVANATAANTLELASGASAGTINGIGNQYQGFQTVTIDSGATWTIGQIYSAVAVDNAGTIAGGSNAGITLGAGGSVTNETSGSIGGGTYGVLAGGTSATVENAGTISGGTDSVFLNATGTNRLIVDAGATFTGKVVANATSANTLELTSGAVAGTISGIGSQYQGFQTVKIDSGATWTIGTISVATTVDNAGTITGTVTGINLAHGGSVTNETHRSIGGGTYGVFAGGTTATVENAGTISGGTDSVFLNATGTNRLIVDPGAKFTGKVVANATAANTVELASGASAGTITNIGLSQYQNFKTITIDSGATWTIAATVATTVDNAGTIAGGSNTGLSLAAGGLVTNEAHGSIRGGLGVVIGNSTGTVKNSGTITGTNANGSGITISKGGSVTNAAGGSIGGGHYGVIVNGSTATVRNAGTISGGTDSVYLDATGTNRLIVDAGATFTGKVVANATAANTLELASGASAGTLNGLGVKYTGFQTVTIDSGATWTVAGTIAGFGGTTIHGFNTDDTLDLTGQVLTGGRIDLNTTTDVLTIKDAGGTTVGTIQLSGNFTGDFFHLSDDGHSGSYVTEDGTPCYCRGTLILTDKGEIAVEDLEIGDLLVTKSGSARPIRWIGTRSYNGRFAAGNRDLLPVLITAGALADTVPRRDLWVSPLHAMYLDDVLIPAFVLVNGTSIVQAASADQIEYFHLELDTHDVIVAEGALSESFLDDDSRGMFHNAEDYARLYPGAKCKPAGYCAPIVEDGPELEAVRRRIAVRAEIVVSEADYWAAL